MNFLSKFLVIVFFTAAAVSCRHERTHSYIGIPDDSIIDKETMISMLQDVHVIEATLQMERSMGKDPVKLSPRYYSVLFSKYKVSEKRFLSSLDYYKQDQATFIKMYEVVIDSLKRRSERKVNAQPAEPE